MKYTILHVLCEGQTEERFVKEVLSPYLQQFGIFPKPILLITSKKEKCQGWNAKLYSGKTGSDIAEKAV